MSPPHSGRTFSNIWKYFEKMDKKGKCLYCSKVISISSGTNSNLKRHLKAKHPTLPFERSIRSRSRSLSMVDEPSSQENSLINPGTSDKPTSSASIHHVKSNQLSSSPGFRLIAPSISTQAAHQHLMSKYKADEVHVEASKDTARTAMSHDSDFRIPTANENRKWKNDTDSDGMVGHEIQFRERSINILEDPYYTYALNLANELRKYDAKTLAHVKKAIADTLFEADMGRLPTITPESFANHLHPHQVYMESPGTPDSQDYECPTSSGPMSPAISNSILPN